MRKKSDRVGEIKLQNRVRYDIIIIMRILKDSTIVKKLDDLGNWILPPTEDEGRLRFRRITLDVILAVAILALLIVLLWPQ